MEEEDVIILPIYSIYVIVLPLFLCGMFWFSN